MNNFKKITIGIAALSFCGQLNAENMNESISGSGCIINYSALANLNQNSQQTFNIQLDSVQKGINEKTISFTYDLKIPDTCSITPTLLIENYELKNQLGTMELNDVRFVSGSKQIGLSKSTGILQLIIEYNVKSTTDSIIPELSLELSSTLSI